MAPNVPLRGPWETESDETSQEALVIVPPRAAAAAAVPSSVPPSPPLMSELPELFLPHLPQHALDPDSPNLHVRQHYRTSTLKPQIRSQSARSTLKVLKVLSAGDQEAQRDSAPLPAPVSVLEDVPGDHTKDSALQWNRGFTGSRNPLESFSDTSPSEPSTRVSKELHHRTEGALSPESLVLVTSKPKVTAVGDGSSSGQEGTTRRRPTVRTSTLPSTTTTHRLDPGVLKLPGHEPEAPADLVLIHHDRAIDTRNQTGLNGIFVRDDSTPITAEGATALILIGICTVFLVFICFFFFVQKIRQQRLERKVEQGGSEVLKPQTTYEGPHSTSSNPLSLLPPALLQALAMASQSSSKEEDIPPSFLTMEPPLSSNSLGRLWFSVFYDYLTSDLVLKVLHARYPKGRGWSSNPGEVWVEAVVLSPLNAVMATANTGTRRASSAPVFKQTFRFKVYDEQVTQYLLRLTLYDRHPDQPGEKASGAVIVPLSSLDLCSQETLARDLQ